MFSPVRKIVFSLVLVLFGVCGVGAAAPETPGFQKAKSFVGSLATGKYAECDAMLSPAIVKGLKEVGVNGVGQLVSTLAAQVGPLSAVDKGYPIDSPKGYDISIWPCTFASQTILDMQIVMNSGGLVEGIQFKPHSEVKASMSEGERFKETVVKLGDPKAPVNAAVVTPKGTERFPVAVMLTGSGPNDMDETVGPNKPFKELAVGLAEQGIATIRFDKRTRVYGAPNDPKANMIDWEYMTDAAAAIEMAKGIPGCSKVVVLGHSEGAELAPMVARDNEGIAGVVCLAGPVTNLAKLAGDQYKYLSTLGKVDKATLDTVTAEVEAYLKGKPISATIIGLPLSYLDQLSAKGNPAVVAKALKVPVFLQFGSRDYQVPLTEATGWQAVVGNDPRFTLKVYPGMNHLLMYGEGTPSPDEYMNPGHVASELLRDLGAWMNAL